jgi:hypothetical protein
MLEVMGLSFKMAEVRRNNDHVPTAVEVNVNIDKVTQRTPEGVLLEWNYTVDYKPDVGSVKVSGEAFCRDTPDNIKRMLAEYKKAKILPMEFGATAINMINANAGMNSIFLIRPFNMLPPFMPPLLATEAKVTEQSKKKK